MLVGKDKRTQAFFMRSTQLADGHGGGPARRWSATPADGNFQRGVLRQLYWRPKPRLKELTMRFIAREVVSQGPEAVHTFTTDDKGMKGLWSNGAIKAQEQDLYYQWGPTRPDWFGTPEPFPDEIRRIDGMPG